MSRITNIILLACLFCEGFVLMGFEMLGGRFLNPYFGSGIDVWACIISVFLLSMTIGYFVGGRMADKYASIVPIAISTAFAGLSMLLVSFYANDVILFASDIFGDRFAGTLITSLLLFCLPTTLLSFWSPFMVRILIEDVNRSGQLTGFVYATSTFGNVCGILITAYILIPSFGVRLITTIFACALFLLSIILLALHLKNSRKPSVISAIMLGMILLVSSGGNETQVRAATIIAEGNYPEGALWLGDDLLFTEMTSDRITKISQGKTSTLWSKQNCGPTSIAHFQDNKLIVLCHLSRQLVVIDKRGNELKTIGPDWQEYTLTNPNDGNSDGHGGIFFSDPGQFGFPSKKQGKVYHLDSQLNLSHIIALLHYPNGVAFNEKTSELYVSEHLAKRVLALPLKMQQSNNSVRFSLNGDVKTLFDLKPKLTKWGTASPLAGPDGIRIAENGTVVFAIYGAGKIGILSPPRNPNFLDTPFSFPTSIGLHEGLFAVVGPNRNDIYPYKGAVALFNYPQN